MNINEILNTVVSFVEERALEGLLICIGLLVGYLCSIWLIVGSYHKQHNVTWLEALEDCGFVSVDEPQQSESEVR